MIELGTITLAHRNNLLALRRKTFGLIQVLDFNDIQATRIASAIYEIAQNLASPSSSVMFSMDRQAAIMQMVFQSPYKQDLDLGLQSFFNDFQVEEKNDLHFYKTQLQISKILNLNELLISKLRTKLEHQSKEELFEAIRQQNNALEEARNDLEQKVAIRTQDLEIASQEAEAANKAKSQFLSNMSHELRTPLNGVLGYVQILQKDSELNTTHRDYLDSVSNCGHHLLTLINDILDLSKIEAGKLELNWSTVALAPLIKSVHDIVHPRAESHGLDLTFESSASLPDHLKIDATKLRQVLVNLLGNSIKFTETGFVKLLIENPQSNEIIFSVIDSGIGIKEENLTAIFSPFQQDEGGRKSGGTGLGLSISKNLISAFGGQLKVESEYGKGSSFSFSVPVKEISSQEMESIEIEEDEMKGNYILDENEPIEVLIVDDISSNREVLGQSLKLLGFSFVEAVNGRDALEKAQSKHFPIIFMDIRMPEMDGYESTEKIRAQSLCQDSVIILLTASVVSEEITNAKQKGFDDGLGKPFQIPKILSTIRKHTELNWKCLEDCKVESSEPDEEIILDFSEIDLDLKNNLINAAKLGDFQKIIQISHVIQTDSLRETIQVWAQKFEFDQIIAQFTQEEESHDA